MVIAESGHFRSICPVLIGQHLEVEEMRSDPILLDASPISFREVFNSVNHSNSNENENASPSGENEPLPSTKNLGSFLAVSAGYKPDICFDFKDRKNRENVCCSSIDIELNNLSGKHSLELLLVAKNSSINSKSYSWIGNMKKFVSLKPSQKKLIRFRVAFFTNGVYLIGQDDHRGKNDLDSIIKLNLIDAAMTNTNTGISAFSVGFQNTGNAISAQSKHFQESIEAADDVKDEPGSAGAICIYVKNLETNRFDYLKQMSPIMISIHETVSSSTIYI